MCEAWSIFDEEERNHQCPYDGDPYCYYHKKVSEGLLSPQQHPEEFPLLMEVYNKNARKTLWSHKSML